MTHLRVSVASLTGTHSLDLARELDALGLLETYYCGLPRCRVPGLPQQQIRTCPLVLAPHAALRWTGFGRLERHLTRTTTAAYDRWLGRELGPCDVFQVLSSYGLRAIRRAKSEYGALTVCDRGSSHIRIQARILAEEAERCGVRIPAVAPWVIEKEETEYAEADLIFVPSTFACRSFMEAGIRPDKVVITPYGVRLEEYAPVPKRDQTFRVLCVAMLTVRKGIGYLLEAMSGLGLPNSEVVLRGTWQAESRALLAPFDGRYRLHPPVPRAHLADLYSQASVLVLPSVEDGFGLVIAQAMACGVPVIATTHTGGPDLITDGKDGFIVPPRSAPAIAERLQLLYNHPDKRAAMGRAALEKVRSLGGWADYARRVVCTYQSRLSTRTGAAVGQ
jgi:glycosyltransferase involved in cell wall biosynthesis